MLRKKSLDCLSNFEEILDYYFQHVLVEWSPLWDFRLYLMQISNIKRIPTNCVFIKKKN